MYLECREVFAAYLVIPPIISSIKNSCVQILQDIRIEIGVLAELFFRAQAELLTIVPRRIGYSLRKYLFLMTDVVVEQVESSDRWMVIRRRAKMLE